MSQKLKLFQKLCKADLANFETFYDSGCFTKGHFSTQPADIHSNDSSQLMNFRRRFEFLQLESVHPVESSLVLHVHRQPTRDNDAHLLLPDGLSNRLTLDYVRSHRLLLLNFHHGADCGSFDLLPTWTSDRLRVERQFRSKTTKTWRNVKWTSENVMVRHTDVLWNQNVIENDWSLSFQKGTTRSTEFLYYLMNRFAK